MEFKELSCPVNMPFWSWKVRERESWMMAMQENTCGEDFVAMRKALLDGLGFA